MQSILLKHLRGIWPQLKNPRHTRLQLLWQAVVEGPFRQPLSLMQVQRLSMCFSRPSWGQISCWATYINTCCMLPVENTPTVLSLSEHLLAIKKTSKLPMKILDIIKYYIMFWYVWIKIDIVKNAAKLRQSWQLRCSCAYLGCIPAKHGGQGHHFRQIVPPFGNDSSKAQACTGQCHGKA